jgi:aminopeptidase N
MVIGAAQFSVSSLDSSGALPVTGWLYPQSKQKGLYDYAIAPGIIEFFTRYIAPFPFLKLAHVQSTTIFGGMENASAIFYDENSITGTRSSESTVSHEIVHQWFGDMASEKSFAHLWLSEGFATYLTLIYFEKKYGRSEFHKKLGEDRVKIINFARTNKNPVVDTLSSYMDLLNANSYQKGGWFLHMLRLEVGDNLFQKLVQTYYAQYKGSNADTRDFQAVAEKVSGKNLHDFFNQWLYQGGIPNIQLHWKYTGGKVELKREPSSGKFSFPLSIALVDADGRQQVHKLNMTPVTTTFVFPAAARPSKIILDPDMALLFEGSISEAK